MAEILVPTNLADLLNQKALTGLANSTAVQMNVAQVEPLQTLFGGAVQAQSVAFSELATLNVPDGTIVYVSDYGNSGSGSYWAFQNSLWNPVNGHVNVFSLSAPVVSGAAPTAEKLQTITIPAGFVTADVAMTFNYMSSASVIGGELELRLYGYSTGSAGYTETVLNTTTHISANSRLADACRVKTSAAAYTYVDLFTPANIVVTDYDTLTHPLEFRFYATAASGTVTLVDLTQAADFF